MALLFYFIGCHHEAARPATEGPQISGEPIRDEAIFGVKETSGDEDLHVEHFHRVCTDDGWCSERLPNSTQGIFALWGSGPDNVYAVGHQGAMFHNGGNGWTALESVTDAWLSGLWGSGPSDIFVVGDHGTILHFDGSSWSPLSSGTNWNLFGVIGRSSSDVVAFGRSGLVLRYDGQSWRFVAPGSSSP